MLVKQDPDIQNSLSLQIKSYLSVNIPNKCGSLWNTFYSIPLEGEFTKNAQTITH